ncbi:multidrug efflux RND transporter permease subunit [uncultured Thiodictyon sp.]|uniref:multidrug efflux RND transporter permease subunit n=1 Tax=uncultured Thiodictyon sp. TaxID=1846217 RepID=UPI0025FA28EA|nr:multidrug efflux RND transporter permease subunit [uncultured Thiodictyon sp.]
MHFTELFIRRPVATTLLTLGLALAGAFAFPLLPVAPLPQVDFPTISVHGNLPGASPTVMAATVATPLERRLGRIAGVTEMTSSSSLGSTRITLQFDLDRDIDGAARDVQAAINAARADLPSGLPGNPTYHKVNPADAPIMILSLTSDTLDRGQMYDAATTILAQKLSQLEGIGEVRIGGSSLPAVRVELNPTALNRYGIGLEDVRTALGAANANRPKGALEDESRYWQIEANDQATTAAAFAPLILAYRNGAPVRLRDVAEVVDSVENLLNAGLADARPAVLLILSRQPGSNILATAARVREQLPLLRASLPGAIDLTVVSDRTRTIRASLDDVERALGIAIVLVILVVFLFLHNARTTLIPAIAVPVSLIGTFSVMYLAGYSIDNLSLTALTIATGFVVDDAIVVLENISRHIERGLRPLEAALQGAREVSFTVLSMSLSLIAVFIPVLLMGGIVGRLFREFAVVLSVAVLISLIVSVTATPMLCARLLRPRAESPPGRFMGKLERGFAWLQERYRVSLGWALHHPRLIMLLLGATVALNVHLYMIVPKGFFPQQDTGRLSGSLKADQAISFQAMNVKFAEVMGIVRADPGVANVVGFTGGGQRNSANLYVSLKPLAERGASADEIIGRLRRQLAKVPGANLYLQSVQDIRMGGRAGASQYQYTLQGDDPTELQTWTRRLERALSERPELVDVSSDQENKGLQTTLTIDRDTASRLGVTPRLIDATLNDAFGQRQVSTIYAPMNQYRVVMEVAPEYRQSPAALELIQIRTPAGVQVPLAAFSRYGPTMTALAVNHQGEFVASTITFNLAPGRFLSDAVRAVEETSRQIGMPVAIHGGFQSTARAFQASLQSQPWLVLLAIVTVYIVLGILYESLVHPLTILSTLPSAGVGALLALLAFGLDFTIMAMIGVLLLIGIVKKNAIMMVDFALYAERTQGLGPEEAIYQACLLRFRPIMMTTTAALFGALPLAIGGGEGGELRMPLGIAIVGGLTVSQLLTLYTTPVVYLYLDRFRLWAGRRWSAGRGARMNKQCST